MKKKIVIAIALLMAVSMVFTGAFAKGQDSSNGGPGGGGQQQPGGQQPGQNPEPMGDQLQNMGDGQFTQNGPGDPININVDAILNVINGLEDEDTKAELLALLEAYQTAAAGDSFEDERAAMQALHDAMAAAGLQTGDGPLTYNYNIGREYGRFLDVDKVAEAIATVTDEETAANLTSLLTAYEDAVNNKDPQAVKDALEALMDALNLAQLDVNAYTGLELYMASQGAYLDSTAVEAAITALADQDTVASLLALLDTYMTAAGGGDAQAAQEALAALMTALEAAGISI